MKTNWKKVKIGDFLTERIGRYKPDDPKITALKRIEKINFNGEIYLADKSSRTDMIIVKDGDLIISGINVAKGAIAVYKGKDDVCATIHYSSYIFDENKINIEYFQWFLKSESFLKLISEQVKGGIKTEIKSKHILPIEISLPNLEIQQDIVEKLNQRLSRINIIALKNTYRSGNITSLRQQILQDVITGKLSEKWRKENPNIESAEILLEKIKIEKEKLVKEGKIRKQKPLPPITENEILFALPEGWVWCRLGEIITDTEAGWSPACLNDSAPDGKWGVLKTTAIQPLFFDEASNKQLPDNMQAKSEIEVKPGDLLITRAGPQNRVGISCFIKNTRSQLMLSDKIIRIISSKHFVNNNFLSVTLNAKLIYDSMISYMTGMAVSQVNISQDNLKKVGIPLPPLAEQQFIVERIESLFAKLDRIKELNIENQKNIDLLNQVVLRDMFSE